MAPRATGTPLARMHASEEGRLGGGKALLSCFFSRVLAITETSRTPFAVFTA